jgi:hypothetical protein
MEHERACATIGLWHTPTNPDTLPELLFGVTFPPGFARLATCPMPFGSAWLENTSALTALASIPIPLSSMPLHSRTLPTGLIAPCLPSSTPQEPSGKEWLHEIKTQRLSRNRPQGRQLHQTLQPARQRPDRPLPAHCRCAGRAALAVLHH